MQVAVGFWASKTLLSAVELELFTHLSAESMTGEQIEQRLALHPRATYDFLDTLISLFTAFFLGTGSGGQLGLYARVAAPEPPPIKLAAPAPK